MRLRANRDRVAMQLRNHRMSAETGEGDEGAEATAKAPEAADVGREARDSALANDEDVG